MSRLIFRHLSGSKRGTVEIYPTARFYNLTIGRDPMCDVRFHAENDVIVSRHHAIIEWETLPDGSMRFALIDLLSSNGTFVNGERVRGDGRELKSGDRLQFGHNGPDVSLEIDQATDSSLSEDQPTQDRMKQTQEMPDINSANFRFVRQPPKN